jgi:hypothetical protein
MKKFTLDVQDDQINTVCKFLDIIPGVEEYNSHPNFKELAATDNQQQQAKIAALMRKFDAYNIASIKKCGTLDSLIEEMRQLSAML